MSTCVGRNTTLPTTGAEHGLGDIQEAPNGVEWMYVRANGAVVLGAAVSIDENYDATELTKTLADTGMPIGIAPVAAADNEYFWVQTLGVVPAVLVTAGPAADIVLYTTATDGALDDTTTSQTLIEGIMLTAAAGTTALTTAPGIIVKRMQASTF